MVGDEAVNPEKFNLHFLNGPLRNSHRSMHDSSEDPNFGLPQGVSMDQTGLLCFGLHHDCTRHSYLQSSHLQCPSTTFVSTSILLTGATKIQNDLHQRWCIAMENALVLSSTLQTAGTRDGF